MLPRRWPCNYFCTLSFFDRTVHLHFQISWSFEGKSGAESFERGPGFLTVVWFSSTSSPSPVWKFDLFLSLPVCRRSSLLTGDGRGVGEGAKPYDDGEKAWSSIVISYSLVGWVGFTYVIWHDFCCPYCQVCSTGCRVIPGCKLIPV